MFYFLFSKLTECSVTACSVSISPESNLKLQMSDETANKSDVAALILSPLVHP